MPGAQLIGDRRYRGGAITATPLIDSLPFQGDFDPILVDQPHDFAFGDHCGTHNRLVLPAHLLVDLLQEIAARNEHILTFEWQTACSQVDERPLIFLRIVEDGGINALCGSLPLLLRRNRTAKLATHVEIQPAAQVGYHGHVADEPQSHRVEQYLAKSIDRLVYVPHAGAFCHGSII